MQAPSPFNERGKRRTSTLTQYGGIRLITEVDYTFVTFSQYGSCPRIPIGTNKSLTLVNFWEATTRSQEFSVVRYKLIDGLGVQ